jgi:hypothetical protein
MRMTSSKDGTRFSRWTTRAALLVLVPVAVLAGARAVTWAAAALHSWADGETLTAADLNANFAALAAEQTPAKVVENYNAGVAAAAQLDPRWMMQHAAAGAACAAASPVADSVADHVLLAKPGGVTCAAACAANTAGSYTNCRTSIAIGNVRTTPATAYTDVLARDYNYGCNDSQNAYDEVMGQGLNTSYTAYCCCYR